MKFSIFNPNHEKIGQIEINSEHIGKCQRIFYTCIDQLAKQAFLVEMPVSIFGAEIDEQIIAHIKKAIDQKSQFVFDFYLENEVS